MKRTVLLLLTSTFMISASAFGSKSCSRPLEDCGWFEGEFYGYGDWLYWTLRRSGLDYVNPYRIDGDAPELNINGNGSCLRQTEIDFTSGYRVGIGYISPCFWGFEINYTHYTAHDGDSFVNPEPTIFGSPTRGNVLNQTTPNVATADMLYDTNYSVLDATMGVYIKTCCFGNFHPYFGGRFAWIEEKADVNYVSNDPTERYTIRDKTDSHAYGLTGGMDYSNLFICNRFGLFAQVGMAIMYGDVEARTLQKNIFDNEPDDEDTSDFKICENRALSTLDISLGVEGEIFCFCGFTLTTRVGYEWHQWFNMISFINLTGIDSSTYARNSTCFAMEGLFIRLVGTY